MRRSLLVAVIGLLCTVGASLADGADPAWLGVRLGAPPARAATDEGPERGAQITGVFRASPAADAGLRGRDRVTAVDGEAVATNAELIERIRSHDSGSWIPLTVRRGDDTLDLRVRLTTRPGNTRAQRLRQGWVGIQALDLPAELREHFGAPSDAGVMISYVATGSPAEAAGFELGDVVFEIDGEPVTSTKDLKQLVRGAGVGNRSEFGIMRSGVELVVEAPIDDAPRMRARR